MLCVCVLVRMGRLAGQLSAVLGWTRGQTRRARERRRRTQKRGEQRVEGKWWREERSRTSRPAICLAGSSSNCIHRKHPCYYLSDIFMTFPPLVCRWIQVKLITSLNCSFQFVLANVPIISYWTYLWSPASSLYWFPFLCRSFSLPHVVLLFIPLYSFPPSPPLSSLTHIWFPSSGLCVFGVTQSSVGLPANMYVCFADDDGAMACVCVCVFVCRLACV